MKPDGLQNSPSINCYTTMKIAAIIIGIFGFWHLTDLPKAFQVADNPKWLLDVWICISGILLLLFSAGIWKRHVFAWYFGFFAIALWPLGFVVHVYHFFAGPSVGEKALVIGLCSVVAILFIAYWSFVWYRQKKWFFNEQVV